MAGTRVKSELRDLGDRLRKLREKDGISVAVLAKKVGVSDGTIASLEKKKAKRLQGNTYKRLVKFLGNNGTSAPKKPTRRRPESSPGPVELPNMSEVEEALGLDTSSSETPALKLSFGRMSITIEVD